jgi:type II secretory pathway pseudopilin PulG
MQTRNKAMGWTLKELLIVIGIMALLAALIYPVYRIARYRALEARCRANLWAIYLKYKQLKSEYRPGTPEFKKAFMDWINHSPESHLYCPLSSDDPFRPYNFNSRTMVPVRYTDEADVPTKLGLPTERMELVAYCGCHRLPPVTSCVQDIDPNEKFLAVFDIGDGVVKYATWDEIRDWITDPDEVRRLLEEGKRGIYR